MKGRFSLLKGYHFGKYRDNEWRTEYGYRPLSLFHKEGDHVFGYTRSLVRDGDEVKVMDRGQVVTAYKGKNGKYHNFGDNITKVYGRVVRKLDGGYYVRTDFTKPVYLNKRFDNAIVCRTNEKPPGKMRLGRLFYGKNDNYQKPEYGYDPIENAEVGQKVYGYVNGDVLIGDEMAVTNKGRAIEKYEKNCRKERKMYGVDDRITKVYGTVVKINPGGSCVVNVEHTNELHLDLRFDRYKLRGKKSRITPEMEMKEIRHVGKKDSVPEDSLNKKENLVEEKKETVVQEQQIQNKVVQENQQKEGMAETKVEEELEVMDQKIDEVSGGKEGLVGREEDVEIEKNELSASTEVEQKYSLRQNDDGLKERNDYVDSVEQEYEEEQSLSREDDLDISI